jgi:glycosyltransferase involved in cell wall biosynthesis
MIGGNLDCDPAAAPTGRRVDAQALLSLVVPCYNEALVLPEFFRRVSTLAPTWGLQWEVVLVDDGSTDTSWELIREQHLRDPRWRGIRLSRNRGHQVALTAGLDHARGDAVVLMDADLQDPPEVIADLLARWREGYDVVYAQREAREGEPLHRLLLTKLFYRTIEQLAQMNLPFDAGHFRLLSRRVVDSLRQLPEHNRFIPGLTIWVGFRQTSVSYRRRPRFAGDTKMSLTRLFHLGFDGITAFSVAPLHWATYLGFAVAGLGLLLTCWTIAVKLFTNIPPFGWSSTMVAILILGGVQLITLGILGEYLGRIFEEVKRRPLYFIQDHAGSNGADWPPLDAARESAYERVRPLAKVGQPRADLTTLDPDLERRSEQHRRAMLEDGR